MGSGWALTRGDSYEFFSADPERHHLCVSWKQGRGQTNNMIAVYGFDAESDQTYYFRATMARGDSLSQAIILEPLNIDEAQLLLASYPHAHSTVKK
jgi:hypothetical protein